MMRILTTVLVASALGSALPAQRPRIMLTGYWPPTNEAVRQFSTNPALNPGGWVGANWEGRGYDVHSFFPEFSPPTCSNCGVGTGQLTVDYQVTTQDFWQIANSLQPIAIITFSRGNGDTSWEVEMNQFNRTQWVDDFIAPTQPTPSPPDASVPGGFLRPSMLPVQAIVNAVLQSGLPVVPGICASGDGGGFLSEFIAYLGVWYQARHRWPGDPDHCIAAGHVHVGGAIPWTTARQAAEVTLRTLIAHVDGVRAVTICQPSLGFQGPGNATLQVCGGRLNQFGNIADLRVAGAVANGLGVLALSTQTMPTPLFGGTVLPVPAFHFGLLAFDAQGQRLLPAWVSAPAVPLPDLFAQVAYVDPALPSTFGLTNALRLVLQ